MFDASGDTSDVGTNNPRAEPRADISQLCVDYAYALRVVVVVAQPTNPAADPGWGEGGDSRLEVGVDTDNDPELELIAVANGEDDSVVVRDAADRIVCVSPFFTTGSGYAMEMSRNCLGVDTVAVSALMVYDPAPAPTTGPLVSDLAPDIGFVPQVTRAAPAIPQPIAGAGGPVCTIDEANDTVDENFRPVVFDAADIVETCVQHGETEIRVTTRMRRATDPQADLLWRSTSGVGWAFDTDNDLDPDFTGRFIDTGARLWPEESEFSDDFCRGTPGFDGTLLIVHFPRSCLGNPAFVAARPFSVFARVAQQFEPPPPFALDLFRFPGFGALVGGPGVVVPVQATVPGQAAPPPPANPFVPGASTPVTTGGGATTTTRPVVNAGTTAAAVTRTSARTSTLASTGIGLDPAVWALGLVLAGLVLVGVAKPRPVLASPGRWDLLPGPRADRQRFSRRG